VLAGPERKTRIPDEETNVITAYHEGGHAIVAYFTKDSHPLHKVTIIPRGPSLGHVSNSLTNVDTQYFFDTCWYTGCKISASLSYVTIRG
jgi:ATP-dependent Zn protease